jgi:hypothetical protein
MMLIIFILLVVVAICLFVIADSVSSNNIDLSVVLGFVAFIISVILIVWVFVAVYISAPEISKMIGF